MFLIFVFPCSSICKSLRTPVGELICPHRVPDNETHTFKARSGLKNMNKNRRVKTSNLPAIRPETQLAFQEAKSMVGKAFVTAIKTNLAFLACSGMYAYRSGQRFWEQKGSSWWARTRAFSKTAYLALQEDAFGSDISIDTLNLDRVLEEGSPTLSIPATPEAVDEFVHKKKS